MTQQATATLRYLRMAPRKVRLVADLIRGLSVHDARIQLQYSAKDASKPLLKLLNSAVANARHNAGLVEDSLQITKITVDGGPILKRWMPRAMGRATPIRKRTSHIELVLTGVAEEQTKKAKKVKEAEEVTAEVVEEPKKPGKKTSAKSKK